MFRNIGQVALLLAVLALVAVSQWSGEVRAERDVAFAPASVGADGAVGTQDDTEKATKKEKKSKKSRKKKSDVEEVPVVTEEAVAVDPPHRADFLPNAFPPVIPDTEWHQEAWWRDDCTRCHETGVGDAPQIVHEGMAEILMKAKCRSCHVFIEGTPAPPPAEKAATHFNDNAFPPMMPASGSHRTAWDKDDCLLCHEDGNSGAPVVVHEGMPDVLLSAKCRSCHVQVRADEASNPW